MHATIEIADHISYNITPLLILIVHCKIQSNARYYLLIKKTTLISNKKYNTMKLLQLITLFLSSVLLMVQAIANVDIQRENILAMNDRYRDILQHDYPNKNSRMLKGGGRGGGM